MQSGNVREWLRSQREETLKKSPRQLYALYKQSRLQRKVSWYDFALVLSDEWGIATTLSEKVKIKDIG
jgi:hypothetical protein